MADVAAGHSYVAVALGGALRVVLSGAEVVELWDSTDPDLRELDDNGSIVLWARSTDGTFRLAPIYIRPIAG